VRAPHTSWHFTINGTLWLVHGALRYDNRNYLEYTLTNDCMLGLFSKKFEQKFSWKFLNFNFFLKKHLFLFQNFVITDLIGTVATKEWMTFSGTSTSVSFLSCGLAILKCNENCLSNQVCHDLISYFSNHTSPLCLLSSSQSLQDAKMPEATLTKWAVKKSHWNDHNKFLIFTSSRQKIEALSLYTLPC
jgi:hypothetical protein